MDAVDYLKTKISIHALRGEGDPYRIEAIRDEVQFQSTPSVGRATSRCAGHRQHILDFNPRPPWGGRPGIPAATAGVLLFQSTPSVGRATISSVGYIIACIFQSTPSVGRATLHGARPTSETGISIHALRGEGDADLRRVASDRRDFNPRPPWGGRHTLAGITFDVLIISIHALRGEGDSTSGRSFGRTMSHFNPRPPWGGRR